MLKIGHLQFDFPVVQAALSGYSDGPMRLLARRFGAPFCFHEVVLDQFVTHPGKYQRKLLTIPAGDHPVGAQLMGAEPQQFADAARLMADAGYDVVDVNFGCPVKKVLGRCRGGYLLSVPDTAIEILRAVRAAVPAETPVTVKMRRGMDDSPKSERSFFRIFDAAFDLGAAAVTVHPRTVRQRYVGPSDWSFLKRVKRHAGDRVVLGSGDLFSPADVQRMLEETEVDGVTLARGCIGNPWVFAQTRALLAGQPVPPPPSVVEQGQIIREHYDLTLQVYGEAKGPKVFRRVAIRYSELHPHMKDVRRGYALARSDADLRAVFDGWYDPQRAWPPPRTPGGPNWQLAAGPTG